MTITFKTKAICESKTTTTNKQTDKYFLVLNQGIKQTRHTSHVSWAAVGGGGGWTNTVANHRTDTKGEFEEEEALETITEGQCERQRERETEKSVQMLILDKEKNNRKKKETKTLNVELLFHGKSLLVAKGIEIRK